MMLRKIVTLVVIVSFMFSGCAKKNSTVTTVGPPPSSSLSAQNPLPVQEQLPKLDVIVPVFDPGLPESAEDYDEENIWPELRRAEANRFAYKLKEKLERNGQFGAIRVTPDSTATGDLYILGRIKESNGEEVALGIVAIDISGRVWLDKTFDHEVEETFYRDVRNEGMDPYDPLFNVIVVAIAEALNGRSAKELENLKYLADLRFGANFLDRSFMPYMNVDAGQFTLISKPSDDDPMLQRVRAIRVRDQLFIDGLQDNYAEFSEQMDESYLMWQKQSMFEIQARRKATRKSIGQAAGGVLLIGLAVLSAIAGGKSDSVGSSTAGTTGAILGGMAGTSLITKSFATSAEAKVHRDSLNELGQSVDLELAPQVVAFEKETVQLTGDVREQYEQWRSFLQKIYDEERTPDVQL